MHDARRDQPEGAGRLARGGPHRGGRYARGSSLTAVTLGEEHGTGLTRHSSKHFDLAFITYAGPWAEARHLWRDRPLDGEDEEGYPCDIHLAAAMREQPDDLADYRAARTWERALFAALPPDIEWQSEQTYSRELEQMWPAIARVAQALLANITVTDAVVRSWVEDEGQRRLEADAEGASPV